MTATCLVVIDVLRSEAIGLALLVITIITGAVYHAVDCLDPLRYLRRCEHACRHVRNILSVILR